MTEKPATFSVKDARRYAMIGALILAALLGGYAWRGQTPPAQPAGLPEPMTIAANTHYAGTGLVFVAQVKGYFANEGLNVTLQPYTTGKDALDAALEGRAELATVADIPIMFAVLKGQPVSIVATIFTVEKDPGIIGRKDKGVLTLASLNGKRIGVTLGTSGHFVLDAFLIRQKLSTDDVTLRDLQPQELAEALLQGDVDAVATWEPYLGTLRTQLGANGMIFYSEGIYELPFTIAGTQDYVVSHPETIKKLMRALVRAEHFCKDEPDAAHKIIAGAINVNPEEMMELWPTFEFNVTLDQSLLITLEDETRWAIKNKLTDRTDMPNYLHHIYLDALDVVMPTAVTVIH
jgi:ABC-type nitrate/sulfonate/bicarbonate transport systems, periplasmic components